MSFRRSFAGVSKAKRRGISVQDGQEPNIPPRMNYPCRDFSVAPFGRSIEMIHCFNVYIRRNKIENQCSIVRYSLFEGGL